MRGVLSEADARRRWPILVEIILLAAIVFSMVLNVAFLLKRGYLPQPFYYRPADTFMDYFNVAYWATHEGTYDKWRAVYPPLSFIFTRLASIHRCYTSALFGRSCDVLGVFTILVGYFINFPLLLRFYGALPGPQRVVRTLIVLLGLPMIYGLERGNLVLFAFALFLAAEIAHERAPGRPWAVLASGLCFNFKPYLAVLLVPDLLLRRWKLVAVCLGATLAIYVFSAFAFGSGWPSQLIGNVVFLSGQTHSNYWNNLYFATTHDALANALDAKFIVPSPAWVNAQALALGMRGIVGASDAAVLACLVIAARAPGSFDRSRLQAIVMAAVLTTFPSSGYAAIFLVALVLKETGTSRAVRASVVLIAVYCLPADFVWRRTIHVAALSFLGGGPVDAAYGVSVGQLLRPALLLAVQMLLTFDALRPVLESRSARAEVGKGA